MSPTNAFRRRMGGEDGFTLIETIVALLILGLVTAGLVPLLLQGVTTSNLGKMVAISKNLATERFEQLRNLPYHVAYQNGPFVDLLDEYYTNASGTPSAITPTSGTGVYVAAGSGAGGSPTGAYYQVTFPTLPGFTDAGQSVPGFSQYSETVYTQFLVPQTSPPTVITPPSTYNSQASSVDTPPSLLVGVTVTISLTLYGHVHSYSYYTQIVGSGNGAPLVLAQSGATAVNLAATAYDGSALSGTIVDVGISGDLGDTSKASAQANGASFTQQDALGTSGAGCPPGIVSCALSAAAATAAAPPASGLSGQVTDAQDRQTDTAESPCGWGAFGPTAINDVTATVDNAQPRAPSDVESGASPAPTVSAALLPQTSGPCSGLYFTNVLSGSPATDPAMGLVAGQPIVAIPNATGNSQVVSAAGSIDTPALPFSGTRSPVTSSASIAFTQPVELFPGLPLAGDGLPLITVLVSSATLSCSSTSQSAAASYTAVITYWSQSTSTNGVRVTVKASWSAGQAAQALPAPATTDVGYANGAPVPLSTYLASWSLAGSVVQQSSASSGSDVGVHTIPAVFTASTQPILPSAATYGGQTAVTVSVGRLTCVAEDNR